MKSTLVSSWERQYLDLVSKVLTEGEDRKDRTGVGTRALFGERLDIDLKAGFPAVTTKKLAWKAVVSELLWFIEGSGDERRLAEILHGTRDLSKTTIWTANAANTSGATYVPAFPGDLGRIYGVQWRHWQKFTRATDQGDEAGHARYMVSEVDQLKELVTKLRANPNDRRLIFSAWNVGELDQMSLPPCHLMAQFFVRTVTSPFVPDLHYLSCMMTQRSMDLFLGCPFNVASYALLTYMLAQVCGFYVDRLIINIGDCHLYLSHFEQAHEQLSREPYPSPTLKLNLTVTDIEKFTMNDIRLVDYVHHSSITAPMAV